MYQFPASEDVILTPTPVIGVLAQAVSHSLIPFLDDLGFPNATSEIGASYVKFIEAAGGRAVPVRVNQTQEYYQRIFNVTNGLLLPGGSVSIYDSGNRMLYQGIL